jgi:hypothetical protein
VGSALTDAVQQPSVPFGRPPARCVPDERGRHRLPGRWRGTVVEDALGRCRCSNPARDDTGHLQHPITSIDTNGHHVADPYRRGCLGDGPVDRDMSGAAGLCRQGAGLENPYRPQPSVDPRALHGIDCSTRWPATDTRYIPDATRIVGTVERPPQSTEVLSQHSRTLKVPLAPPEESDSRKPRNGWAFAATSLTVTPGWEPRPPIVSPGAIKPQEARKIADTFSMRWLSC